MTRRRVSILVVISLLTGLLTSLVTAAPHAAAVDRLAVQVMGAYQDGAATIPRQVTSGVVVGAVQTMDMGFLGQNVVTQNENFGYTVTCATSDGQPCAAGSSVTWDFGDGSGVLTKTLGTDADALFQTHPYTTVGSYTVRVSITTPNPSSPAFGSGAIRALAGAHYADVDSAYTGPAGSKPVNPVATSVWAMSALGIMGACKPYYAGPSYLKVPGERAEDPGRAVFCTSPGNDTTTGGAGSLTTPATNGVTPTARTDSWTNSSSTYTDVNSCFTDYLNCGLPADAFQVNPPTGGTNQPAGGPLASCSQGSGSTCAALLVARGLLTSASSGLLRYNPTNCADNWTAILKPDNSGLTAVPGVEPGCESRGDFLQALQKAVDGTTADNLTFATNSAALDTTACAGQSPDPNGRDGIRRMTALLDAASVPTSPCDPEAYLSKGEAYKMLAGVLGVPAVTSSVTLPDLDDRSLGWSTAGPEPYPGANLIRSVLSAGAPIVGSTTCPSPAKSGGSGPCFNPYEPMTRAMTAQLLSFFVLGDTSDVAALSVSLTASSQQVKLGDTATLSLTIRAPAWLTPYAANVTWSLGGGLAPATASNSCGAAMPTKIITDGTPYTASCLLQVNALPSGGVLPVVATVNGTAYTLALQVVDIPPVITSFTPPALTESGAAGLGNVTFFDPSNVTISQVQVSSDGTAWSDLTENKFLVAQTAALTPANQQSGSTSVSMTPQPYANGSYTLYLRACDIGNVCGAAYTATGTISAVDNAPVAYPISGVNRNDNVVSTTGSCTAAQTASPLQPNTFALVGADPLDAGWSGYTGTMRSYNVTAPAGAAGALYVCASTGSWQQVNAGSTVSAPGTNPVVLWNPTVGTYGTVTYSYTVTDNGYPIGGLTSPPQTITVSNSAPAVPPTASLSVSGSLDATQTTGATYTTEFRFDASASNTSGDTTSIVSYAFNFGDGTSSGSQSTPVASHRYTAPGTYPVTVTVTNKAGLTATASTSETVRINYSGNPTFESGVSEWNPAGGGGAALAVTTTNPHGGLQAAAVTMTSGSQCMVSHTPPALVNALNPGTVYKSSIWVLPTADSAYANFTMTVTETLNGSSVGSASTNVRLGAAGTWQLMQLPYTAARQGSSLSLSLGLYSFTGVNCFNLDDNTITIN